MRGEELEKVGWAITVQGLIKAISAKIGQSRSTLFLMGDHRMTQ